MRVAIMGSGGIGGYIGARLAQSGYDVTFIARGANLAAMKRSGLRLKSPLGNLSLPHVKATEAPSEVGIVDVVIFAVKLYDSESAAAALVPMVGVGTRVVTLQNGIDSRDILAMFVPRAQVVGGVTYLSAHIEEPGLIVHVGGSTLTAIGGHNDRTIEWLSDACLRAGGIDIRVVEDIDQVLWYKFVTVAAFSGGTSLMRSGVGPILADPEASLFVKQLRSEGMAVASAAGHPMPAGYEDEVMLLWQQLPPDTRSSMAIDLDRGRPIELTWLSGRMHELGFELGVPTPAHTAVYRALHLFKDGTGSV